ncbi:transcriptional regulator, LysR family [Syntrophobotulus glycolicus DSM 8271]|uniref:Transcriptional regulator, LysR family n=1 Tax=Syntrophobotulus glycolicus (strain DSM 8271 / FlGlyR) TaxID=645991 RepID=F0SXK3_SYNGF|nr:LysR family transcriptional regulator [Syntrophobotulus glycolicus]ADY55836.1 transcriptional regulator, LysR family [Syntrophobotulus glycolicus DSM 8271]
MDLKQLKYFLAIAEEQQITAAAKKLHIAQPPLSYQLNLLEQELGVKLVKRGPRNVELTDAGKLLRKRAEQILDLASSAKHEVENYGKGLCGVLAVGTISSSGGVVPNQYMLEFTKYYPEVRFEIYEGNTFTVIEMLEKGIVDLGIVRTPFQQKMFDCRYAPLEPMVAVMTESRLCGQSEHNIELEELANQPLIIYRRFDALIQAVFAELGLEPFICCKNDDARTTLLWAQANFGIGIVPKSALLTIGPSQLICKEILHDKMKTRIAAIWMKNRYLSPLAQRFVELFGG